MTKSTTLLVEKRTEKFTLRASVSDDRMKLFVDIEPGQNTLVIRDDVLSILKEITRPDLIHTAVVEDIVKQLRKNEKITERRVAKGIDPEPGSDGKVLLLVKKFSEQAEVKIDDKGFAQFGELQFFDNIKSGQVVARLYPPKKGKVGLDVTGKAIPSPVGAAAKSSFDKTLKVQPADPKVGDYETVVAENNGYLKEDGGKFSISSELFVKGDVDFHIGNVDFIGAVKIGGSVRKGFSVRAVKGIEVLNAVEDASLYCSDGNITVKGIVVGGENGKIVGAGEVFLGLAEGARVECQGRIVIKKEAIECVLRSGSTIELPDGRMFGGECFAVCGVEAKEIGNEVGKTTIIHLCSTVETTSEFSILAADIEGHEKAIKLIELHLGPFLKNSARIVVLKDPFRSRMEALLKKHKSIEESRIKLLAKKKDLLEKATANNVMRVNVKKRMYEGVVISAGEESMKVLDPIDGPKSIDFLIEEKKFLISDYKPLECEVNPPKPVQPKK